MVDRIVLQGPATVMISAVWRNTEAVRSVTRCEEFVPFWVQFKSFWKIHRGLGKISNLAKFCKNLMHFGNCLSLQKAEYLKNNVVIWSHWLLVKNETSGNEPGLLA